MKFVSDILAQANLVVDGSVTLNTTANATVDTDKFLVQDGTVVKYRTGAQVLSDIGAQGALTLTTTGSSGASTLIANTLNIPTYTLAGLGGVPLTRTINGLALSADQTFATGTTGTDFNIVSAGTVHTFNIPDASGVNRGLITAGTQTIAGVKTFTSSPIVPSLYLANMGAGSGAVYYDVPDNRLTLANYNAGGEIKFEVNGGVYTMTLNSDLTIELMGYTSNGFLKTSGGNGLLVVDTTSYTPTTRTLTINGTALDLSADRSWSVGTVTSVGLSVPTGFSVANSPVTTSGTIALSFASGYSLPTNASQTNWDAAYTGRISSLTTTGTSGAATFVANVLNIPQYQAQGNYITSLTGEATGSGPGATTVTLTNSAVIGKVLTGLSVTSGAVVSTDSILQAFGKVQGQINALAGGLQFQGTWNANTNTPTITSGVGSQGHFYIVNVAGNTTIDGNTGWQVGDWILFDGTVWQKVDNTDAVTSVNGQTGAVVLTTTNISEGTNLYYTDARARLAISLTTTGSSGAATYSNVTGVLNVPQYTLTGLGGVPTTRTITINGTVQDLSADRTWSVGTVTSIATTGPITGGTITGSGTIGITQSTTTTSGYLSSTDWNTFNNKQNAITLTTTGSSGSSTLVGATLNIPSYTLSGLGGVPDTRTITINGLSQDLTANRTWSVGTVTSITFSGPLTGGTITGSGTVGITQASGSTSGYLSNTDWTTFNNKQNAITLTTTGSSGASTLVGATLNIPTYSLSGLGGVPSSRTLTINGTALDLSADRSWSVGTVTSVAALTIGTTGTDLTSSVATGTTTPVITLNVPTASASARGALSSSDWTTFNNKQNAITLTVTGSSGSATLVGATLNIPTYTISGLGGVPTSRTLTINGSAYDLSVDRSWSVGTVTSVAALTLGTSGTDLSSSVATGTTTPVITLNVPTASATNRGALSSTDWSTFNNKQNAITLTVTGSSGSATLVGATLNIPTYTLAGLGGEPAITAGTTAQYWRGDKTWQNFNTAARASISLTTTGTSGAATYDNSTGVLNIPQYQSVITNPVTGTGVSGKVAYWSGTNTITYNTSFVWDNTNGRLGIGVLNPVAGIEVSTNVTLAYAGRFVNSHISGGGVVIAGGSSSSHDALVVYNYDFTNFVLVAKSNGNVGFGTATPGYKLDVVGDIFINGSYSLKSSTNGNIFLKHVTSESNSWIYQEAAANWGMFVVNDNTQLNALGGIFSGSGLATFIASGGSTGVNLASTTGGGSAYGSIAFEHGGGKAYFAGLITIGSIVDTGLAKLQVTGAIQQTSVTSSMLKTNSNGVLVAAVAGTDYLTSTSSDFTYNASLTISTSWQDSGVSNSNLTSNGVYIVTVYANDAGVAGYQYSETYVGLMYWYASNTNNDNYSEISLHHMGHADNDRCLYLRTKTTSSAAGSFLQVKGNYTTTGNSTYTFTFKRLL